MIGQNTKDSIVVIPIGNCVNVLDLNFNDLTSSIKTNACMQAWEHINCSGEKIKIASPGIENLTQLNFDNHLTSISDCNYGKSTDKVVINMDTSKAPELKVFGQKVKKIMENWFPFVQNLMSTSAYKQVTRIDVFFDPDYDGVAYAGGGRIVGSVQYFKNHQNDYGAFIHEMTHVIHQARVCPGWLVEGYAEWTRRWFYEPWTTQNKPNAEQSYKEGYSNAAWLMVYINSAITDKPVLYYLNKACQEGTWYDGIFQDLTGKTVDELWEDMLNDDGYPWKK